MGGWSLIQTKQVLHTFSQSCVFLILPIAFNSRRRMRLLVGAVIFVPCKDPKNSLAIFGGKWSTCVENRTQTIVRKTDLVLLEQSECVENVFGKRLEKSTKIVIRWVGRKQVAWYYSRGQSLFLGSLHALNRPGAEDYGLQIYDILGFKHSCLTPACKMLNN